MYKIIVDVINNTCCRFSAGTDLSNLEPQILPNVAAIVVLARGTLFFGAMKEENSNHRKITKTLNTYAPKDMSNPTDNQMMPDC